MIGNAAALVEHLERRIATGDLEPGDRLVPVRDLAAELGLAPNTVASAYRSLRDRGLTVGRGRSGTFVAGRPPLTAGVEAPAVAGLVDLASGHPDAALLPDIQDALGEMHYEPATYATSPVDPDLARCFLAAFAADGVPASSLAVVGGALDGLERVLTAHCRPGDRVAVEDPAYVAVLDLLASMNLVAVPVAIDERGPMPAAFDATLASGCAAAVLTPRAQNPTGAAIDAARASELRAVLQSHPAALVVEDDHAGSVAGAPHEPLVPGRSRWAIIRSVSKSLGPDLRLAAVVGDDITISRIAGRQAVGAGWVSHVLQRAVVRLMETSTQTLEDAERVYTRRRTRFLSLLEERGVRDAIGRSGLNVWVPVVDEAAVVAGMQRRGFAIRSGARFRIAGPPGVRVTVASSGDDELVTAADALGDLLAPGPRRRTA